MVTYRIEIKTDAGFRLVGKNTFRSVHAAAERGKYLMDAYKFILGFRVISQFGFTSYRRYRD